MLTAVRFCSVPLRADRDVCATGAIGLGRSATKPRPTTSPCANPHHVVPESNHGPHNPIRHNPSFLNSTINPSYQIISNTKGLNLGNVNHLSFQFSKSHRVPNVEDADGCGICMYCMWLCVALLCFHQDTPWLLKRFTTSEVRRAGSRGRPKSFNTQTT